MAQTTGAAPQANFQIEVTIDGSAWTDISGSSNNVEPSDGEQMIGEVFTADGSVPVVVGSNKVGSVKLKVSVLYTNTAGEPWAVVYARFIGTAKTVGVRYAPKGSTSANKRYVTSTNANAVQLAPIISCLPPAVDASSGDPIMFEFSVQTSKLYEEAIP